MDVGATIAGMEHLSTSVRVAIAFMQGLCRRTPRLLVIGLDLLLPEETAAAGIHRYMTLLRAQVRRQAGAFAHCLGMIWTTRLETNGAVYIQALFIFDGGQVRQGITRGNWIGDYWQGVVTEGGGLYRNLNRLQPLGTGLRLGMFHAAMAEQIGELYYRLIYQMGASGPLIVAEVPALW